MKRFSVLQAVIFLVSPDPAFCLQRVILSLSRPGPVTTRDSLSTVTAKVFPPSAAKGIIRTGLGRGPWLPQPDAAQDSRRAGSTTKCWAEMPITGEKS